MSNGSPSLLVRAVWFVLVGWWLTGVWLSVAWFLTVTIVGIPFGIWMLSRVPKVLTLKARTADVAAGGGSPNVLIRAVYFLLVGWWLSGIWTAIAYAFALTIVGLPVAIVMFNYLPTVVSLYDY